MAFNTGAYLGSWHTVRFCTNVMLVRFKTLHFGSPIKKCTRASSVLNASGMPRGIFIRTLGCAEISGVLKRADWPRVLFIGSMVCGAGNIRFGISSFSFSVPSRGRSLNARSIDNNRWLRGMLLTNFKFAKDLIFLKTGSEWLFNRVKPLGGPGMLSTGCLRRLTQALGVANAWARPSFRYNSIVEYEDFILNAHFPR